MNIIKKYWDSVYLYVLLLVPGFCMCAGIFWTVCKAAGLYPALPWFKIILFDGSQFLYLSIAVCFILKNRKDASFIPGHLTYVKGFIVSILFIQYCFILSLFPSVHVWECTFLFFAIIVFLFDTKLMFLNIVSYFFALLTAHILNPEAFLPFEEPNTKEILAYRFTIFILTSFCIMLIVYFVERFLIQARENQEENVRFMEKQLAYYRDMDLLDRELRKFRHDIKNHFLCMETLLCNNKTEELQVYFQDLQHSFPFQKDIHFSGNEIVDAILHYDLPHYCKEEVNVTLYGRLPEIKTVSSMDLCTLFSNLLSNAIASANQCAGTTQAHILIRFSSGKTYFSIAVSNSTLEYESQNLKNQNRNHGFGIHKINEVIEKYDGRLEKQSSTKNVTVTAYLPI